LNCVEIGEGVSGYLLQKKMHKEKGKMEEGERRVDHQVIN
jgi:hypothetical protein